MSSCRLRNSASYECIEKCCEKCIEICCEKSLFTQQWIFSYLLLATVAVQIRWGDLLRESMGNKKVSTCVRAEQKKKRTHYAPQEGGFFLLFTQRNLRVEGEMVITKSIVRVCLCVCVR